MAQNNNNFGLARVFNLSELEDSGIHHFRLIPGDVIEFEDSDIHVYKQLPVIYRGKPRIFVGCKVNGIPRILPISAFRNASCIDYHIWISRPEMKVNRLLHELPNDYEFIKYVQGRTLKCVDLVEGDRPTFCRENGLDRMFIQRDENGNIITRKVMYPVFEIL